MDRRTPLFHSLSYIEACDEVLGIPKQNKELEYSCTDSQDVMRSSWSPCEDYNAESEMDKDGARHDRS